MEDRRAKYLQKGSEEERKANLVIQPLSLKPNEQNEKKPEAKTPEIKRRRANSAEIKDKEEKSAEEKDE